MFIAPSDLKLLYMSRQSISVRPSTSSNSARFQNRNRGVTSSSVYDAYQTLVTPYINVYTSPYQHKKGYEDLASSNPYANVSYRESPWQRLLSHLGFRTGKDAYIENMRLQAAEYDNALLQKEYNETYDSPIEQAARERAAGLNPNLTGNVSAGESAELPEDGNPPVASSDDLGEVTNFASSLLSCVSTAYGFVNSALSTISGIQDIKAKGLANKMTELDFGEKLSSFAEEAVYRNLPAGLNIRDYGEVTNYYNKLKKQYGSFMSKKDFARFIKFANDFQNNVNVEGKYWKGNKEYHQNRKDTFRIGASSEEYSEDDAVMFVFSKALSDLATKVYKSESRNRSVKADYESDYLEAFDPKQMAEAETVRKVNEATITGHEVGIKEDEKSLLDTKVLMRETVQQIISGLDNLSNQGSFLAQVAKGIASIVAIKYLGF